MAQNAPDARNGANTNGHAGAGATTLAPPAPAPSPDRTPPSRRPAPSTEAGRRPRTRRASAIPTPRAALGALLVTTAAVVAFSAYSRSSRPPTTRFVVTARAIDPGSPLSADDLRLVAADLPAAVAARVFRDPAVLEGATTLGPLDAGEFVQLANVTRKPGGAQSRELAVALEQWQAAGGRLRASDRVDVVATFGSGDDAFTVVVARDAFVVRADRDERSLSSARGPVIVTLAVDDPDVGVAISHAAAVGKLNLVRTTGAAAGVARPPYRPSRDSAASPDRIDRAVAVPKSVAPSAAR